MTKSNKKLVNTIGELNFYKLVLTKDEFYSNYELSMELVSKLCAKKCKSNADKTDRMPTADELKALGL